MEPRHEADEQLGPPPLDSSRMSTEPEGPPRLRRVRQYGLGAGVLLTVAFLAYQMMLGPVHGVADASECARAYADARSRTDTVSVDFMSYPDTGGRRRKMLCGLLRPMPVVSLGR
ncbi:MAG: hypothetical protein V4617_03275 [Gemmatimonadota bacterium]